MQQRRPKSIFFSQKWKTHYYFIICRWHHYYRKWRQKHSTPQAPYDDYFLSYFSYDWPWKCLILLGGQNSTVPWRYIFSPKRLYQKTIRHVRHVWVHPRKHIHDPQNETTKSNQLSSSQSCSLWKPSRRLTTCNNKLLGYSIHCQSHL